MNRRDMYLAWVRRRAAELRRGKFPPRTLAEWEERRRELRRQIAEALGYGLQRDPCELEPRVLREHRRAGYRIQCLVFQSRPGIWVTANLYIPDATEAGPVPAVLSVHGHWREGRIARPPHMRALGLVKQGYLVLAVDAFGSGERAPDPLHPEYHGGLRGAACWTAGYPLLALQVYDNMRAVDYLISRADVDPTRIAVTGASGGGNQSMYVGAIDERIRVVVPVCSVGNYQAYLGVACCVGEVLPGALRFCEEGDILGLIAPRPLLVMNASRDSVQFSIIEAAKSVSWAREIYRLYGAEDKLRHAVFDAPHGYDRAMREALYGWLNRWFKDAPTEEPLPEPELEPELPETLRCFPDGHRFDGFLTQPQFVATRWKHRLQEIPTPTHREAWESQRLLMEHWLEQVLGGPPRVSPQTRLIEQSVADLPDGAVGQELRVTVETGISIPVTVVRPAETSLDVPLVVVADPDGEATAPTHPFVRALLELGVAAALVELRATGSSAVPRDRIADAVDHNSCEWGVWIGDPLAGQWARDLLAAIEAASNRVGIDPMRVSVACWNGAVIAGVIAAIFDDRIRALAAVKPLASHRTNQVPAGHRMVYHIPHLARVGDLPHLYAMLAPRRLILAEPRSPTGQSLDSLAASQVFRFTRTVYALYRQSADVRLVPAPVDPRQLAAAVTQLA